MEIPYRGRAMINEYFDGAEIIIPVEKGWFIIAFSCVWLCLLLFFGVNISIAMLGLGAAGARIFLFYILLPLMGLNAFFVVNRLWWAIAGKELINVTQEAITIRRKGDIFKRTKSYDLTQCSNFRAIEEQRPIFHYYNRTAEMLRRRPAPGTIKFDYDIVDTIQFGDWLPQAKGNTSWRGFGRRN